MQLNAKENNPILEKQLKKFIIKTHQEIFGRGPEEVWVKIHRNVATFYCSNSLTQLENYLLETPGGESEVIRIRKNVANHIKPQISSYIEMQYGLKIFGITIDFSIPLNIIFGAILFEENLEDISED